MHGHASNKCILYEFFIDRTLRSAFHASWAEIATRAFVIRKAKAQRKQRTNIQYKIKKAKEFANANPKSKVQCECPIMFESKVSSLVHSRDCPRGECHIDMYSTCSLITSRTFELKVSLPGVPDTCHSQPSPLLSYAARTRVIAAEAAPFYHSG